MTLSKISINGTEYDLPGGGGGASIDDTTTALDKVWSSKKTSDELALKADASSVPVIPSDNVTGTGTSGYIAKFNGSHGITNGPAFGSDTTVFLRNDGTWQTPPGGASSVTVSKSLAANATSLSFTNAAITASAMIDVYTSVYGVNPTKMAVSGTTLTLTFPSSHVASTIKIQIWE